VKRGKLFNEAAIHLSTEGIRHCGLNGTFQIQLRPFGED
jgi:hypothetical protein